MIIDFLKFHNVAFKYDFASKLLFDNICFHISSGWTGVVGVNGSGKTTLLKLATGIFTPIKGEY